MAGNRVATLLRISALSHRGLGPKPLTLLSRAVGPGASMEVIYSLWSLDRGLPMAVIL